MITSNTLGNYHRYLLPPVMPGERTLWCIVDHNHEPAPVKVPESANIDDLKEAIKEKFGLRDASTSQLVLWKLTDPELMDDTLSQRIKSYGDVATFAEKLSPSKGVSTLFPLHPLEGHVHVLVELRPTIICAASRKHPRSSPAEDEDREQKREKTYDAIAEDADEAKRKQDVTTCRIKEITPQLIRNPAREWAVNRAIRGADMDGCYYVDPGTQDESKYCLNALLRTQFVLLVGAPASGKTTRLLWLKRELEAKDYQVIYISFKRVSRDNVKAFWNTFGYAVQAAASTGPFAVSQNFTPISTSSDFLDFFHVKAWKRKVVLVLDEFSDMYQYSNIQGQYIGAFREIRNNPERYAIHGIMAAGTPSDKYMAPMFTVFNIADHVTNPYFSIDETRKLFLEFAQDNFITIDNAVIEDVWAKSNGHPGMVCLCGRIIYESLPYMLTFPERVLSYKRWQTFSAIHLHDRLYRNDTFQPMIVSLLRESATSTVNFLRSHFVGIIDTVFIYDTQLQHRAEFLTAEGVLRKSAPHTYHMASAFVDGLIRRHVIPKKFPSAPSTPFPMTHKGQYHVLEFLTQSLKFFDKHLIRLAAARSCKQSNGNIGGLRAQCVPRESVYETELLRILTNWLSEFEEASVHWHIPTGQNKNHCNIVISQLNDPTASTIVLNILATGDVDFVRAHIEKTPHYKDSLSSDEAWVVHFTCEDDYLNHPTWQSDEQLQKGGINVVHFWHDLAFSTVSMSARWKDDDGIVQEVNNQRVAL